MTHTEQVAQRPVHAHVLRIYAVVLSVGVICAVAIVGVYEFTRPIIKQNQIAARQQAILDLLPGAITSETFRFDESTGQMEKAASNDADSELVFAGFDDEGTLVGLAMEAEGMGYQDVIRLLYAYSFAAEAVIGIRVLQSRETPGLGDSIEKDSDFLANFQRLDVRLNQSGDDLANRIAFVKAGDKKHPWQIDGITGATISSRAVAEMLSESTARWIPIVRRRQIDFVPGEREVP